MPNIFEQLMTQNRQLTESNLKARQSAKSLGEAKKISASKIKLESRRICEETDADELDAQFAVDPEDSEESEVVLVVDPELPADEEVPEDAAENMIGDKVYKCPICGANYVCNCNAENESIEVDENGVPSECPICGDDVDQILVGEIAPAEGAGEEIDEEPATSEDEEEIDDIIDDEIPEEVPEDEDEEFEESVDPAFQDDTADDTTVTESIDLDDEVDYDADVDDVDGSLVLDTDSAEEDGSATVSIDADTVNLRIDESRLESMMNTMMKENFKFNPVFKVKRALRDGKILRLEYVVRQGKKSFKGVLRAEGFDPSRHEMTLRVKDRGVFTESFTKTPSFVIECVCIRNTVIPTALRYDFKRTVNESVYRVVGSAGKSTSKSRKSK